MANKNNKKNSNELDVILEQLKKSYGSEAEESSDDDLLDSAPSETDEELNRILNELFSSEESSPETESKDTVEDTEDTVFSFEEPESNEGSDEVFSEKIELTEKAEESEESEQVDDVLNLMFGNVFSEDSEVEESTNADMISSDVANEAPISILSAVEEPEVEKNETTDEDNAVIEDTEIDEERFIIEDSENVDEEIILGESEDMDEEIVLEESEIEEEEIILEDSGVEEEEIILEDSEVEDEEIVLEESEDEATVEDIEPVPAPEPVLILTRDKYTYDPLQAGLPKLKNKTPSEKDNATDSAADTSAKNTAAKDLDFDSNDISLLVNCGYDGEIEEKIGSDTTQKVLFEEDGEYVPEKTHTPFGFCGRELTNRSQIADIRDKYKKNKKGIIILLSIVSLLSLIILANTVIFEFFSNKISDYPLALVSEFVIFALIGIAMCKSLVKGWIGIVKFEPNRYVPLAYFFSLYIIYDMISLTVFIVTHSSIVSYDLLLIGFCVSLYAVITLVADLLNCIRESAAFDIIASTNKLFTAEHKKHFNENSAKKSGNTFKIRESGLINGYFRKSSYYKSNFSLIVLLGITPIISLALGFIVGFICNSVMKGVATVFLTIILSSSLSYIFIPPLFEFLVSVNNHKKNVAFIGGFAAEKHSEPGSFVFSDKDAIGVESYSLILPEDGKNSRSYEPFVNIAYDIFLYLGGPLADIARYADDTKYKAENEMIINSIGDNGIDIYYNSSVRVIIGDADYMMEHGIKVKTSTELSTATKNPKTSVLYMAFDKVPRLGFIIDSKIKPDFERILMETAECGIDIFVETYNPQINNRFLEKLIADKPYTVRIVKPHNYEENRSKRCDMCNGSIVTSGTALDVVSAIKSCPEITNQKRKNALSDRLVSLSGVILAVIIAIIACFNDTSAVLSWIDAHLSTLLIIFVLLGTIPGVISSAIFNYRRDNKQHVSNGDKKKNERKA